MKIAKGMRVKLKADLSIVGGADLEKSAVEYIHGGGTMLPGLEKVLEGLEKGAKREGTLAAKEAFGHPAMHPTKKMKMSEFGKDAKIKVGDKFTAKGAGGGGMDVVLEVAKITGDDVDVRLGHPLADKDIKYSVEVLQVTDPKPPPMPASALKLQDES